MQLTHPSPTVSSPSQGTLGAPLQPRPDQRDIWLRHNEPMPFRIAATEILIQHHLHGARTDIATADLRGWAFGSGDGATMQLVPLPLEGRDTGAPKALREHAFGQLATKLGVPGPYVRQLPGKIQAVLMNYEMSRRPMPALLRLAGGEVRALLSPAYCAMDDATLFEIVDDVLVRAGLQHEALVRASATGLSTVHRITIPSKGVAVRKGDVIEHGIDIANSEVGLRSVQVNAITYRLVCSNGLRAWNTEGGSRYRHTGDPARLRDLLRDAIPIALAEARGDLERWKLAVDRLVDDAFHEVESLRAFGIGGGEMKAVARAIAAESGVDVDGREDAQIAEALRGTRSTTFEVANSITAFAKTRNVSARLALEESAHRYLVARTR